MLNSRIQLIFQYSLARLLVLLCFTATLPGCIGFSQISRSEGIAFQAPDLRAPYVAHGFDFTTVSKSDPGNKVVLSKNSRLTSNCYIEQPVSAMLSLVIPFPPIIPLFPEEPSLPTQVVFTISGPSGATGFQLTLANQDLPPIEQGEREVRFGISCSSLRGQVAALKFKRMDGTVQQLPLAYKRSHSFGVFWLRAGVDPQD